MGGKQPPPITSAMGEHLNQFFQFYKYILHCSVSYYC